MRVVKGIAGWSQIMANYWLYCRWGPQAGWRSEVVIHLEVEGRRVVIDLVRNDSLALIWPSKNVALPPYLSRLSAESQLLAHSLATHRSTPFAATGNALVRVYKTAIPTSGSSCHNHAIDSISPTTVRIPFPL